MSDDGLVELRPVGRGPNLLWRLLSVAAAATGPVIAWFGHREAGTDSAQFYVGGVLALFLVPTGIGMWRATSRARRRLLRLDAVGLPAVGEVLTAESDGGEMPDVVMAVRISGPDVPPFEVTVTARPGPTTTPGSRLTVLVDPADGSYLIRDFDDADFFPGD
ncbi:hypothetical protein [Saccharothrix obliqua]|uniref:hypothetical protein n=1 Tax=Saccharothrix obliqua TaxID=2861747 RepID=UPI001C606E76|nr:hypothetical protein [Saccharothrix obliqua]MBW4716774.1 hypothetical protein [Saccharothrix obliqua]